MKSENEKFCPNCGKLINQNAEICPNCGVTQRYEVPVYNNYVGRERDPNLSDKDWLTTLLLCLFLGGLGIHRFYTDNTGIAIGQLFTGGGCGIWAFVDLILLITGNYKDGEDRIVKDR